MQVNPQQWVDNGYIILPQVVPPDRLESLRASHEKLVDRQHQIWAGELEWDEPIGMDYKAKQPRVVLNSVVDADTADTVAFCLHDNTLGVSRQIMQAPQASPTAMFFMCNPKTDHGPDGWHRDIGGGRQAPLRGLQEDMLANTPASVQWNIPLYDDDVLWIVPGSHRRANTPEEDRQLAENRRVPLPGGMQVKLKAGDGVVYSNMILHWPSLYSTKLRRVIHLGYRPFGGQVYPYSAYFYWNLRFTRHLSPAARSQFERFAQLSAQELDHVEAFFRAVLAKDEAALDAQLTVLHPGEAERIVCVVLLSRLATKIHELHRPEIASLPHNERAKAVGDQRTSLYLAEDIARRFSAEEVAQLKQRFASLEARLVSDVEMPSDFGVEEFIASWDQH
ncbi:MAG: hypothetical protein CL878_00510 [Dehalococcoidia bacterium]|nr:hypothetical protein [Dehalococcoidia bacterium]